MLRNFAAIGCTLSLALTALPTDTATAAGGGCISDKSGDTHKAPAPKADRDITSACGAKASHHRIVASVVVKGTVGDPKTAQGSLADLFLDVPGQKFDNPTCDYFVQGLPPGAGPNKTKHAKWYVFTCQNSGAQPVGPATVTRPTSHRLKFVIHRHEIGNPKRFGWAVAFPSDGDQPPYDRAPQKGYRHLPLR